MLSKYAAFGLQCTIVPLLETKCKCKYQPNAKHEIGKNTLIKELKQHLREKLKYFFITDLIIIIIIVGTTTCKLV